MDLFELVDPAVAAQLVEQPAPPDRLQLAGITDQHQPPLLPLGKAHEPVQVVCADHPGLVDDHRRGLGQPVGGVRFELGAGPFVEQLGDGVRGHAGVPLQNPGLQARFVELIEQASDATVD